ncbi:hypothetical protein TDB9533_02485 [Thalassocella blandensis]|nr:hypothetical protein TDB9533_02485 [Thalassocella blandensis]
MSVKKLLPWCLLGMSNVVSAQAVDLLSTEPYYLQDTSEGDMQVTTEELRLTGNRWVSTTATYSVTADTVLQFQFYSNGQGEIHGIALDADDRVSSNRVFMLYGTTPWGITDAASYTTPFEYQQIEIPVGEYFTGENMRVTFINDKDAGLKFNTSYFRNVKLVTKSEPEEPIIIGDCELSDTERELILAHNSARAVARECGNTTFPAAPPLRWDCRLPQAAQRHAEDMATNNHFSHTGTDGSSPWQRMREAGYNYSAAGENIAAGYRSVASAVQGWLESPGHCANIMSANVEDLGSAKGESSDSDYGVYWSSSFGRSR